MTDFRSLSLPEVIEITPDRFGDHRGYFSVVFNQDTYAQNGIACEWMQENESLSAKRGTVRGIHYQLPPFAQAKLVRVLSGKIFDIAVDLRRDSPRFGQWDGCELSADKGNQLFVPAGFGHAFMTLTDDVLVQYKVDAAYAPQSERSILWNDSAIGIDWPSIDDAVLSGKDADAPRIGDLGPDELF
ncbi:dTDP-4-dehydrorhamnose 3,5-epimerase [Novosphingopyxis iocasae]|uniref:dTDP-4-dehydrorhamnose 3,5-epimerase n=1 Tax=Novosphingopyxis iocasae TaxID=2762729 RepID=UPI001FE29CF8|nr:dTDP-4-dehydrorhamnose 3,5-epimerase [Novosphingopyxis iocasae]